MDAESTSTPNVHEVKNVSEEVLRGKTEAELIAAAEKAQKLVSSDSTVAAACAGILASRQCQIAAMSILSTRMAELGHEHADGVEFHLLRSMAHASSNPFTLDDVLKKLTHVLLPLFTAEKHAEASAEQAAAEEARSESDRVRSTFSLQQDAAETEISAKRGEVVLLTGNYDVCRALTPILQARLCDGKQAAAPVRVLRFLARNAMPDELTNNGRRNKFVAYVGRSLYEKKIDNAAGFFKLGWNWRAGFHAQDFDVALVDDLVPLISDRWRTFPEEVGVADTCKYLRKWAIDNTKAVVALSVDPGAGLSAVVDDRMRERVDRLLPYIRVYFVTYDADSRDVRVTDAASKNEFVLVSGFDLSQATGGGSPLVV